MKPTSAFGQITTEDSSSPKHSIQRRTGPALRLDIDLDAMPLGSGTRCVRFHAHPMLRLDVDNTKHNRLEFEERFKEDIARTLEIEASDVIIESLKPAPNLDWLTIVEFTLGGGGDMQKELTASLQAMLKDTTSVLYEGTNTITQPFAHCWP